MLDRKDFVHAFEAEAAFPVQEIGDVGLLEFSLLGEPKSGEFTCFDTLPKVFAKIILQDFEFHWREYSTAIWASAKSARFPQAL